MGFADILPRRWLKRSGFANPAPWLVDALTTGSGRSGVSVTPTSAMKFAAVFAAVRVVSETVAMLPLHVYRRTADGGRERAETHRVARLLDGAPNPMMTAFTFREALQGHLCTWGNAYAEIVRDRAGRLAELWPLRPDRTIPELVGGALRYRYRMPDGTDRTLPADRVLHIPGLSFDGLSGYSPIAQAREAIGLGIAAERAGAAFFGNNSRPAGILRHPGHMNEKAKGKLEAAWHSAYGGPDNAGRVAVVEGGIEWQPLGLPQDDAQWIETRTLQLREVARLFRIPPHLLGDLERATFSNIEAQGIEFVTHCVGPWLRRWEQEIARKLLAGTAYYAEHKTAALLRGDIVSRYRAYATARQWGWMSANDVRRLENMNPVDGGDLYLSPQNMIPADRLGEEPAAAPVGGVAGGDGTEGGDGADGTDGARAIAEAHRPLLAALCARAFRREAAAVKGAVRRGEYPDGLANWYEAHRRYIADSLRPAIVALAASVGNTAALAGATEYVDALAARMASRLDRWADAAEIADVEGASAIDAREWATTITKEISGGNGQRATAAAAG